MKKFLIGFIGVLMVIVGYLFITTSLNSSIQPKGDASATRVPSDDELSEVPGHLAGAIQFPTVSNFEEETDSLPFLGMHRYLDSLYPKLTGLERIPIGDHTLLYRWKGKNAAALPILFLAHQDVVPIEPGTEDLWVQPPFSGNFADTCVYGRGAIDDKGAMIAIMEGVEWLLNSGYQPEGDVYLLFGEDEEIGGKKGAIGAKEYFESKNITFKVIIDEGGVISDGLIPGLAPQAALIGTTEKGYMTIKISAEIEGGHSSMPGESMALTTITHAIDNLMEHPFDAQICDPVKGFIAYLGPEMQGMNKIAFSNSTLLEPLILNAYEKSNSGRALTRTTIAPTIFNSGIKDNVIPRQAEAYINFRILPGESISSVQEHLNKVWKGMPLTYEVLEGAINPTPVTDHKDIYFKTFGESIKSQCPELVVSPYIMLGATDSRHLAHLSPHVFRFTPFRFNTKDLTRFHGINERVRIPELKRAVKVYADLLQRFDQLPNTK